MLNEEQKYAAYEMSSSCTVSACPGSGKTKTLVARADYKLDLLPQKYAIAVITYTNAAADEIATRLVTYQPIFIGTIHKFCLEYILRPFSWLNNWVRPRIINYDELQKFIENNQSLNLSIDDLNLLRKDKEGNIDESVDWNNINPIRDVARIYYVYLDSFSAIDFNEVLFRSYKIISENTFVAKSLSNKFYEILIDEFQDTNNFQYEIFKIINASGPVTFFMVGDERQSIYRFAGAINSPFEIAKLDFMATEKLLTTAYRSTNIIVKTYSSLFENHPLINNESECSELNIPVVVQETNNNNHADYLLHFIHELHYLNNIQLDEIAILSARWLDSLIASRALRRNYNVVGLGALPHPMRNFNNSTFNLFRTLVRFMYRQSMGLLRAINRSIDLYSIENNISLEEKTISIIQNKLLEELNKLDLSITLVEGLQQITKIFDDIFGNNNAIFYELINNINEDELPFWTLDKYFKTLSGVDGITINTIHQAKGLEYDAVILDQMNVGRIPYQTWDNRNRIYLPLTDECTLDGRKLFYVALSRARKHLIVLHNWNPSMFIGVIRAVL